MGVTVKTTEAEAISGQLERFDLSMELLLAGQAAIPVARVVRIETTVEAAPAAKQAFDFELTHGDRLRGKPIAGDGQGVVVAHEALGRISVPLETVRILVTPAGRRPELIDGIRQLRAGSDSERDHLLLANGDTVVGLVAIVDQEKVSVEVEGGLTEIPLDRLAAVRLAEWPAAPFEGLYAELLFDDGSRLTLTDLEWDGSRISGQGLGKTPLGFDAGHVVRLDVLGGAWVWLDQLEPISFQHTPVLRLNWPWQRNRNVLGRPMRIAHQAYDRGIGVHSEAVLIYDLAGKYDRFLSWVGLDDESGPLADVTVEVRVDGQSRFWEEGIRAFTAPKRVDLDLRHAKRLELIAHFGRNADIQDRVDWAEAALIR
jgi:hypothetical protein